MTNEGNPGHHPPLGQLWHATSAGGMLCWIFSRVCGLSVQTGPTGVVSGVAGPASWTGILDRLFDGGWTPGGSRNWQESGNGQNWAGGTYMATLGYGRPEIFLKPSEFRDGGQVGGQYPPRSAPRTCAQPGAPLDPIRSRCYIIGIAMNSTHPAGQRYCWNRP